MIRCLQLLCLVLLLWAKPLAASEVIHDFEVHAVIDKTGIVTIDETISVTAENQAIKHGIYRDIPTIYNDPAQGKVTTGFSIEKIERDGRPEAYHTEQLGNGIRIYMGDKNAFVSQGFHTYHIRYKIYKIIGFFKDYDEFYWNVTGNGWVFPIQRVHILVETPEPAKILKVAGYTGAQGEKGVSYRSNFYANVIEASTTRALSAREGFTIAGAFTKGIIPPPGPWQSLKSTLLGDRSFTIFVASIILTLAFYIFAWWLTGRDNPLSPIIPRFDIMDGVTPDMLRYVYKQKYDDKVLSCFIVDAAVRHKVKIQETSRYVEILRTSEDYSLSIPEKIVFKELFSLGRQLLLPKSTLFLGWEKQRREDVALQMAKVKETHKSLFQMNTPPVQGANLAEFGNYSVEALSRIQENIFIPDPHEYFSTPGFASFGRILVILLSIIANFYIAAQGDYVVETVMFQIAVFWLFRHPMLKYSSEGQEIYEYAKGLRMYLSVAEKARLNKLYPKDITPEVFERFLPYALALDVEHKWCKNFARAMENAGRVYKSEGWYGGHHRSLSNLGNAVVSSLGSSISSASRAPGSSSGSGGGGSSGGGGGGGGGGGW